MVFLPFTVLRRHGDVDALKLHLGSLERRFCRLPSLGNRSDMYFQAMDSTVAAP